MHYPEFGPPTLFPDGVEAGMMEQLTNVRTIDVSDGQKIGYLSVNAHLEGPPFVYINGFYGDLTMPDSAWVAAHASTLGMPVHMLDLPGHGISTPMTTEMAIDLCVRLNQTPVSQAQPLAEATHQIVGNQDYFIGGVSHGSFMAVEVARMLGGAKMVLAHDMPAQEHVNSIGLYSRYLFVDSGVRRNALEKVFNATGYNDAFEQFKAEHGEYEVPESKPFHVYNPGTLILNILRSIDSTPAGLRSLGQLLLGRPETSVDIRAAVNSGISSVTNTEKFLDLLPDELSARVNHTVVPGDHNITHTVMMPTYFDYLRDVVKAHR